MEKNKDTQIEINNDLLNRSQCKYHLQEFVTSEENRLEVERIIAEYRQRNKLRRYGLKNCSKILIEGCFGTGRSLTASVLATELNLPLFKIQTDKVVTKQADETIANLRKISGMMKDIPAVFLFEDFDTICANQNLDNDVANMRRVLNSFLQFLENDNFESIFVATINNSKNLSRIICQKFDVVLHYEMPDEKQIQQLFEVKMGPFFSQEIATKYINIKAVKFNHAELTKICENAMKESILNGKIH